MPACRSGRSAGVLLHLSSLPSGRLDDDARQFLELVVGAGLSVWQLLPLGPPAAYRNPFEPASAFAGDAALLPATHATDRSSYAEFRDANQDWLADWTLFSAIKTAQHRAPWWEWPEPLRWREPEALANAATELAAAVERECLAQFHFEAGWLEFRRSANARGVRLFGDLPLLLSRDSADVWVHRELFEVDADGRFGAVAGVPPDEFSATGQSWDVPPYRWDVMAADGFGWWKRRFEVQARRYDLLRLDHFRGFAAWWRIPPGAATAAEGSWVGGPGRAAIDAVLPVLADTELVAEDLGVVTPDVVALRRGLGIPGMRVLQFAFDGDPQNPHLPHHHDHDSVCYTGTHDNDTTLGWWRTLSPQQRERVGHGLGQADPDMPGALVDFAWSSPAALAIVPMQDLLGLGTEARMNRPGVAEGNWRWSFSWDQLPGGFAPDLRSRLQHHGRSA